MKKQVYVSIMDSTGYYEFLHGLEDSICEQASLSSDPYEYLRKNAEEDAAAMIEMIHLKNDDDGATEGCVTTDPVMDSPEGSDMIWLEVDSSFDDVAGILSEMQEYYRSMAYDYITDYYIYTYRGEEQ